MSTPIISIIIPTFNRRIDVLECLNSVSRSPLPSHEVIVVDNRCTDGTSEAVKAAFPNVRIIRSPRNLGVTGGRNLGASLSRSEFLFFLDHDTIVERSAIARVIATLLTNPSIGIAGTAILRHDDSSRVWALGTAVGLVTGRNRFFYSDFRYSDSFREILDVPIVPTAFAVSKKLFELAGGFDNEFFAVYEDSDFCFRVRKLGYRVVCVTNALVWSKVDRPSSVPYGLRSLGLENSFRAFHIGRNRILFLKRHAGPLEFAIFAIMFLPAYVLYFSVACSLYRRLDIFRAFLVGTLQGIKKRIPKDVHSHSYLA